MDLQNHLKKALKYFVKEDLSNTQVYVYKPSKENLFRFCVVITGQYLDKVVRGSSSGTDLVTTYLKALSELGENIICDKLKLDCRSGIAGGLFRENSIHRAKSELIERDAFLYHYRNISPFKKVYGNEQYLAYSLASIDPAYSVSFIMCPEYLTNKTSCLIFGMGCDYTPDGSFQKAYAEYSTMYLNHRFFECIHVIDKDPSIWTRKADFHHNCSVSEENKLIFNDLSNEKAFENKRTYNSNSWIIEDLESPLRFFKFVRVDHPELEKLRFGKPETCFSFNKPVYHPFW